MSPSWQTFSDAQTAAEACGQYIVSVLETAISGAGDASIAISGGSTPKLLFAYMAKQRLDWSRIHLFWVDERCVPPTDDQSNFKLADEQLIKPAKIPQRNVHRIRGELSPQQAARRYEAEVMEHFELDEGEVPYFDVVHLGMGPDGHTASLFPGDPLIEDRERIVEAAFIEKIPQWRVTLMPAVLLAAHHAVLLVAGEDKAPTVRRIFEDQYEPAQLPAQLIAQHANRPVWFLDEAAAAELKPA